MCSMGTVLVFFVTSEPKEAVTRDSSNIQPAMVLCCARATLVSCRRFAEWRIGDGDKMRPLWPIAELHMHHRRVARQSHLGKRHDEADWSYAEGEHGRLKPAMALCNGRDISEQPCCILHSGRWSSWSGHAHKLFSAGQPSPRRRDHTSLLLNVPLLSPSELTCVNLVTARPCTGTSGFSCPTVLLQTSAKSGRA